MQLGCPYCSRALQPGIVMVSTVVGAPDFLGDPRPATLSTGGPGRVHQCLKCPKCGYSITVPATTERPRDSTN